MLFKRKKQVEKQEPVIDSAYQADRRDIERDRRSFGPPTNFPVIDSAKNIIQKDRRSRPERRINNIVVTETNIKLDVEFL